MPPDAPTRATHYVYLLLCANGSIYVGQTQDISARLARHYSGTGARHTAGIKPIELIYKEGPMPFNQAIARERQIKKWSRAKKLDLAFGNVDRLCELSMCRTGK